MDKQALAQRLEQLYTEAAYKRGFWQQVDYSNVFKDVVSKLAEDELATIYSYPTIGEVRGIAGRPITPEAYRDDDLTDPMLHLASYRRQMTKAKTAEARDNLFANLEDVILEDLKAVKSSEKADITRVLAAGYTHIVIANNKYQVGILRGNTICYSELGQNPSNSISPIASSIEEALALSLAARDSQRPRAEHIEPAHYGRGRPKPL